MSFFPLLSSWPGHLWRRRASRFSPATTNLNDFPEVGKRLEVLAAFPQGAAPRFPKFSRFRPKE